jgi:hypothetical protein
MPLPQCEKRQSILHLDKGFFAHLLGASGKSYGLSSGAAAERLATGLCNQLAGRVQVWQSKCCLSGMLDRTHGSENLQKHLELVHRLGDFPPRAGLLTERQQFQYLRLIRECDALQVELGSDDRIQAQHTRADAALFEAVGGIEDRSFPTDAWMGWCRDPDLVERTFLIAEKRIRSALRARSIRYNAFWRSIKRRDRLEAKVAAEEKQSGNLWDAVRFRLSVAGPVDVQNCGVALQAELGADVVRVCNFYRRTRMPQHRDDPYRAVHLGVRVGMPGWPSTHCELQIVTEKRDALGLIDHCAYRLGPGILGDEAQARWLKRIRMAGNILDAEDLGAHRASWRPNRKESE